MGPGVMVSGMVVVFLVVWYGALALSERNRRRRPARSSWSGSAPSTDAATQAAIDTVVICSTIDAGHHG